MVSSVWGDDGGMSAWQVGLTTWHAAARALAWVRDDRRDVGQRREANDDRHIAG